jgi:hypothetical protein
MVRMNFGDQSKIPREDNYMLMTEKREMLAAADAAPTRSEWMRWYLAANACGLGKTRFYELLNEARGEIRTLVLKSPGGERGARLVHLGSLTRYLDKLAAQQQVAINASV